MIYDITAYCVIIIIIIHRSLKYNILNLTHIKEQDFTDLSIKQILFNPLSSNILHYILFTHILNC